MRRTNIVLLLIILMVIPVVSQSVDLTQMDNRRLLLDGTLSLFFLPRDNDGLPRPLMKDDDVRLFSIAPDGSTQEERIISIEQQAPEIQGINFLLLIDNSGSMHAEKLAGESRYATASGAVDAFLQEIDNPLDMVGLAAFNTSYTSLLAVKAISPEHREALKKITLPTEQESFTELYRSLKEASAELASFSGRRAMIVLSDGENYPYTLSGSPHPVYGETIVEPEEVTETLIEEGISLYAVHIGNKRDALLDGIARDTGGRSFSADDRGELSSVYSIIRDEIQHEFRLRFRPRYGDAEISTVMVDLNGKTSRGHYYIPHFLGLPGTEFRLWFLIPLLSALALTIVLLIFVWEKPARNAEIGLLSAGRGFSQATRINIDQEVTVIGAGAKADMTIAGNPGLRENHATILFDSKSGRYTVQADEEFKVNNKHTKQRLLKSGDVIDFGGSTVVFDKPEEQ